MSDGKRDGDGLSPPRILCDKCNYLKLLDETKRVQERVPHKAIMFCRDVKRWCKQCRAENRGTYRLYD